MPLITFSPEARPPLHQDVRRLIFVTSAIVVVLFSFACFITCYGRKRWSASAVLPKTYLRIVFVTLISLSYLFETCFVAWRAFGDNQDEIISTLYSAAAWASVLLPRKRTVFVQSFGLAALSVLFGVPLLVLDGRLIRQHHDSWHVSSIAAQGVRLLLITILLVESCTVWLRRYFSNKKMNNLDKLASPEETTSLLGQSQVSVYSGASSTSEESNDSGSTLYPDSDDSDDDSDSDDDDDDDNVKRKPGNSGLKSLRKTGSWMRYVENFKVFLPFLIPRHDLKIQGCILVCLLCVAGNRALNILVPAQLGVIADKLFAGQMPFLDLGLYLLLSLLHDDSGLDGIEALAKIPITQFSNRQLTNAAFNHVMGLGLDFHSDSDSAEVMTAIEQGNSLTRILETAVLEMIPTLFDMVIAFVLLYAKFDSPVALCMLGASFTFVTAEVTSSSWNIANRRVSTKAKRKESRAMHQAVQGWQTVFAFNMFSYEKVRFGQAVEDRLKAEKAWSIKEVFINGVSQALVPVTFFLVTSLVVYQIHIGKASPGDFVFLIQYWDYLIWPIKFLSHEYRYLMNDLIDAEKLLDLLMTKPTITTKPDALEMRNVQGLVEFDHVGLTYGQERTAIKDISLTASHGQTIALVGTTGSGKSSLMKLLMRHYDVSAGSIRIDGYDIRDLTQDSLREAIGIVPQEPLLFNASIMENVRYARLDASDEEVYTACRAAAIHDKISSFPSGYNTNVGEQGVKLSGGEVQRLAIARVFLKNPPILILDEATSAVDTGTEVKIQAALYERATRDRTTFVIAHRLSTIVDADQIVVLEDGLVVERGTHQELMEAEGEYYGLWRKQLSSPAKASKGGASDVLTL